jgi:hypothetical protein
MGQCLPCNCWWCNCFGVCAGCAHLHNWWGYWCCKPNELLVQSPESCYCCQTTGHGYNCFCFGSVCFAPEWLTRYSKVLTGEAQSESPLMNVQSGAGYIHTANMQPSYNQPGQGQHGYGNQPVYNNQQGYNHQPWEIKDLLIMLVGMIIMNLWIFNFHFSEKLKVQIYGIFKRQYEQLGLF